MNDDLTKQLNELLERSANPKALRDAVEALVPNLLVKGFSSRSERTLERRFAHSHFAPIYFALDPERGVWTKEQLENALSKNDPKEVFVLLKNTISSAAPDERQGIKSVFVDTLDDIFSRSGIDLVSWFSLVFSNTLTILSKGDSVTREFFGISFGDRLRSILIKKLKEHPAETQFMALEEAIKNSDDLSLIADLIRGFLGDAISDGVTASSGSFLDDTQGKQLRDALLKRTKSIVVQDLFWQQLWPANILWFWRNSGNEAEVQSFTQSEMKKRSGALALMDACIHPVISTGGNYEAVRHNAWSKIIDLSALKAEANRLEAGTDPSDAAAAQRFLQALEKDREEIDDEPSPS